MDYRTIPSTDIELSTIGIGGSHLHELTQAQTDELINYAHEQGVNLIDTAISYPEPLDMLGHALKGKRDSFIYQMHVGMTFPKGQYLRTRQIEKVRKGFEAQLSNMQTDYADIGFVHYVDEPEDFDAVFEGGTMDYALSLKERGIVRFLGFASHNVEISNRFIETGLFDIGMFSINAAYDFDPVSNVPFDELDVSGIDRLSEAQARLNMYQECEKRGIGLVVMKPYGGGILLDANTSPFGRALTIEQCLQYALDRPAVLSCVLGISDLSEMKQAVGFYEATPEEKDYSCIATMQHKDMKGTCVYCNHCLPCPAEIDIAAVHKYFDLYEAGDDLAKEHYYTLSRSADDCIQCGNCESRCPFGVQVRQKMNRALVVMGS